MCSDMFAPVAIYKYGGIYTYIHIYLYIYYYITIIINKNNKNNISIYNDIKHLECSGKVFLFREHS